MVPTCWAWRPPGPSSSQACGHLEGSATEKQISGGAHGSMGSWGRARRAPRPPCLGLKSSLPFYGCDILITIEFSKWAPCWTKTRILGILPSYNPVDERSWLNNYSLIPECRLHAWKYMVQQRIAKSMTFFNFNFSFLCTFPLFSLSIIILGLGSKGKRKTTHSSFLILAKTGVSFVTTKRRRGPQGVSGYD